MDKYQFYSKLSYEALKQSFDCVKKLLVIYQHKIEKDFDPGLSGRIDFLEQEKLLIADELQKRKERLT